MPAHEVNSMAGVGVSNIGGAAHANAAAGGIPPENPQLKFLVKATGKSAAEILSVAEKIAAEQKISIGDALIALESYVKEQMKAGGAQDGASGTAENDDYSVGKTSAEEKTHPRKKLSLQEKQGEANRLIADLKGDTLKLLVQLIDSSPYIFTVEHLNALFGSKSSLKYEAMTVLAQRCPNLFRPAHAEALVAEFRGNPAAGAPLAVLAIKTPHILTIAQLETLKAHFESNFLTRYINAPLTGRAIKKVVQEKSAQAAVKDSHAAGSKPEFTKTIVYLIKSTDTNPAQVTILRHLAANDIELARSIIKILAEKSATNAGIADALADWALTEQQHAVFIIEEMIHAASLGKEGGDAIAKIVANLDSTISDETIAALMKAAVEGGNFFCASVLAKIIVALPKVREEQLKTFYDIVKQATLNTTTVPRILEFVADKRPEFFTTEIIEFLTGITTEQTNYASAKALAYVLGTHKFDEKHLKAAILALSNAATEKLSGPSARVLEYLAKTHPEFKEMIIAALAEAAQKGNEPAADAVKKLEALPK